MIKYMENYKCLVIGDIHGRPYWKQIIEKEKPNMVIFIGDYFDSYNNYTAEEEIDNFNKIIKYKESEQSEVIILIGNHDYHYIDNYEQYSGFKAYSFHAINDVLNKNKHHLSMIYQFNNFLFSHAGVSYDWLLEHGWRENENIVEWVSDMWLYKPNIFRFAGYNPYGNSVISSPIWIRPEALQKSNKNTFIKNKYIQIVGHTQQTQIDIKQKTTGGRYYYIDTLGTSGEYLIINNDVICSNTYKKNK